MLELGNMGVHVFIQRGQEFLGECVGDDNGEEIQMGRGVIH